MKTIRKGDRGDDVKTLQQCLNLAIDGIFGEVTEEQVKAFQRANNLVADGIVGPATWNKLSPVYKKRKVNDIILHCSATPEGKDYTVDTIRSWHKAQGWSDIGYHYVIYRDGSINKGRDEQLVGTHCSGHNSYSIGVCYIGGCDSTGKTPKDTRTKEQKVSQYKLVHDLLDKYGLTIDNVHCHNSYTNKKACPSFKLEDFKKEYKDYFK